jgi:hypothetical protein
MLEERYLSLPEPLNQEWRKLAVFADNFDSKAAAWVWGMVTKESDQAQFDAADREAGERLGMLYKQLLLRLYDNDRYYMSRHARKLAAGKNDS